jgi:glycosyltransferase involved in cell wall biosynthesis
MSQNDKLKKALNLIAGFTSIDMTQDRYTCDAFNLSKWYDYTYEDLQLNNEIASMYKSEYIDIKRIAWFIPDFENAFWGGIHTILRFASYFKIAKNINNSFIIFGDAKEKEVRNKIAGAFPLLKDEKIYVLKSEKDFYKLGDFDATICTLWMTAYHSLRFNKTKRKFYFIQDFEPLFYPAGSSSAQAEATYRFGFHGIANTETLKEIYDKNYGNNSEYFNPCVDTNIFYPEVKGKTNKDPYTVFFYARPGHPRNGFELGIETLKKLKDRMGDQVIIVTAGSNWRPKDLGLENVINNLGLLTYRETANLYRECDVGLSMMFTKHPSYIPFELMASGCLVVANVNPANAWLLQDKVNCLLSPASASCICQTIEDGLKDTEQREKLTINALNIINKYNNWEKEIEKIYGFMCNTKDAKGDVDKIDAK